MCGGTFATKMDGGVRRHDGWEDNAEGK